MYAIQPDAITLVVMNSEALEGRSTSSHVFRGEGGTLGSGTHDDWLLQDHRGRIRPGHADITRIDGRFCLIDTSGQTFINHTTLPLERGRKVLDGPRAEVYARLRAGRAVAAEGTAPRISVVE